MAKQTIESFKAEVTVKCPCGKEVSIGKVNAEEAQKLGVKDITGPDAHTAMHEWPPCEKYLQLDLLEYLEYLNRMGSN